MGCNNAKVAKDSQTNANHSDAAPTSAPAQDSRIPLNPRQKFSISKSWKAIARAMEPTGVAMFVKLFEDTPELLELFEKFRHLKTKEAQSESMELVEHANTVMSTLDESIMSLDNVDYCIDYLHNVGRMHRKVQGFKSEYFWKMEEPFLCAVKETLGDRYTDNMESIYKTTIHFILETVVKGYDSDTAKNSV